jgi:hypothetical protein
MDNVKIPGIKIKLGDVERVFPPLNLKSLKLLQPQLESFKGGIDINSVDTVLEVAMASLKRNYPDIAIDELEEYIDVSNMNEIIQAVMDVSGLRRKAIEQEAKLGEAAATSQ